MKRKIALAMVLAMTASMAQPVLAADSKTTLDVIISQYGTQTQTWWTQFEKDFEAENPDIDLNVEIVSWNDLYTKVNTLVANNNAPDILNIDVLADYVADDLLMPATEYASEDLQAKFFPAFWEASTIDDTVYALPILASCRALFYNKDILDEAGASVPTTWAEVQETAQKIKDKFGDDVYPWGIDMTTDEGQAAFSYYTWNNGGGFVDENGDWALNSDKNVEALNFAIGLVNDGYTNSDPANETRYDLQDMFGAGKVAMMIGPNNIPTYLSDGGYDINYDVTTIPANEGCDSVAMGVCDRLEVFKDDSAEDQEARTAAISKFFDFFYDDERYADYMVFEGFLPTTQTAADLLAKDDDTFASWIDILQSCNFYPATKTEWADVKQGVIEVEQNALLGDDVQTLLDDLLRILRAPHLVHHGLLLLQIFVDGEEVGHFREDVGGQLADIVVAVVGGILEGDGDDLFIQLALIQHGNDADGIAAHQTQGLDHLAAKHQHVQRVVVVRIGAGNQAVVGGIVGGGVQDAVQNQGTRFLVQLVFFLAALFDLDDGDKVLRRDAGRGNVMPDIAHNRCSFHDGKRTERYASAIQYRFVRTPSCSYVLSNTPPFFTMTFSLAGLSSLQVTNTRLSPSCRAWGRSCRSISPA